MEGFVRTDSKEEVVAETGGAGVVGGVEDGGEDPSSSLLNESIPNLCLAVTVVPTGVIEIRMWRGVPAVLHLVLLACFLLLGSC